MYLLKKFAGDRFDHINALLEQAGGVIGGSINLIASCSYPFPEVLETLATPMMTLPTEGHKGRRYFPFSEFWDQLEGEAETVVRRLFNLGTKYSVSIQPHSGTQANQIVFEGLLSENRKVLALKPDEGGHVSHSIGAGNDVHVSFYSIGREGLLDYDEIHRQALAHQPGLIIAGTSSYPRAIDYSRLAEIAKDVGALLHADISHTALFVMTGTHPPVFPYADSAAFNMMKNLRGPSGGVLIYRTDLRKRVEYAIFPKVQGGPHENDLLAKLLTFQLLEKSQPSKLAKAIIDNARELSYTLASRGLQIVTNGTDSHLILVDLRRTKLTGRAAENRLFQQRILLNRNQIPGDDRPPWIASGIRMGTTCISILKYSAPDVRRLGNAIADIIEDPEATPIALEELLHRYQSDLVSSASVEKG